MAANFTDETLEVIKLETTKIAVRRAGPITFGFGGASSCSDRALTTCLSQIVDALTFYNGPMERFYAKSMKQSAAVGRQRFEMAAKDVVPLIERFCFFS